MNSLQNLNVLTNKHYQHAPLSTVKSNTMKIIFDATLNLKSVPNELVIFGTIYTACMDDNIVIEAASQKSVIDTVLTLQLKVIDGKESKGMSPKPFIYRVSDESSAHYTNVTIQLSNGTSKTQIVKIIG